MVGTRGGEGRDRWDCPGGRNPSISGSSFFFHAKGWAAGASPGHTGVFPVPTAPGTEMHPKKKEKPQEFCRDERILFDDEIICYCGADGLIILREGISQGRKIFKDSFLFFLLLAVN